MRSSSPFTGALLIAFGLFGCDPGWRPMTSEAGRFRYEILLPIEESESDVELTDHTLRFRVARFVSDWRGPELPFWSPPPLMSVGYADLSGVKPWNRNALRDELANVHEWRFKREDAILDVERKRFATRACAGIELVFRSRDKWGRERICLVEDRLYVLDVAGARRQVVGGLGEHFFESFEVREAPARP